MNASEQFELGDSVIVIGGNYERGRREPQMEGHVTARGETALRISYKGRFGIRQNRWFSTHHDHFHIEKTKAL